MHTCVWLLIIQIISRFCRHIFTLKLRWQAQNQLVEAWEKHGSVFERRRRNVEEIQSALAAMEDGEIIEEDVNANI